MLAWMGGSRKKLKEAKNRRFGGGTTLSPKGKKIAKSKISSTPQKGTPRILKSTPVKSTTQGNNPFERQCYAIAQGLADTSNQAGPSHQIHNKNFIQNTNEDTDNENKLHSKQFELLMGAEKTNLQNKYIQQLDKQKKSVKNKPEEKIVELSPVFQGSLDLLVIQMTPENFVELEEESLLLSDGNLELDLE